MSQLLSIGEMAARCGLSRSALRFYDECGLLRPALTDEPNGYRYYEKAQVADAELVRRLRSADVPVPVVKAFLAAGPAERADMLAAHMAGLEARLTAARSVVEQLALAALGPRSSAGPDEAPGPDEPQCRIGRTELASAVCQVLFAADRQGARPELGGALLECKEGSLRVVATDSYRLAIRDLVPDGAVNGSFRCVAGRPDLVRLAELLGRESGSCVLRPRAGGGIDIDLDGIEVQVAAMAGDFPDYETVLSGVPDGHQAVFAHAELSNAFSLSEGTCATMSFGRDGLQVEAVDRSAVVPGNWPAETRVLVNANLMAEAINAHVGPDISIEVAGPLRPLTLRSADEGTLTVLVMPIRPNR